MRVVAVIQARMGSSRLPGKVLLDICGQAMLGRVASRTSRSQTVNEVLVATTTDAADDALAKYCAAQGLPVTRGSQFDVLDRYHQTALDAKADVVVRITADCPLIDADLIDDVVRTLLAGNAASIPAGGTTAGGFDFAANRLPPPWMRTYPIGLDVEACTFDALERAWTQAREPQQREHVMPYMYEGVQLTPADSRLYVGESPRRFRIALLQHTSDFGSYRWTVDTAEDLDFVRQIFGRLGEAPYFSWEQVLGLVHSEPELMQINAAVPHKTLRDIDERAAHP